MSRKASWTALASTISRLRSVSHIETDELQRAIAMLFATDCHGRASLTLASFACASVSAARPCWSVVEFAPRHLLTIQGNPQYNHNVVSSMAEAYGDARGMRVSRICWERTSPPRGSIHVNKRDFIGKLFYFSPVFPRFLHALHDTIIMSNRRRGGK